MSHSQNNRLAFRLFAVYLVLYGGFMVINVWRPSLMELTPLAGVNVAIWYGFGLIFAAVILAFVYGFMCREETVSSTNSSDAIGEEQK